MKTVGKHDDPAFPCHVDDRGPFRLLQIFTGARKTDAGGRQRVHRFLKPLVTPVQYVIIGERAVINPGFGETGHILRMHLVVDALTRPVVTTRGNARFQVNQAQVRRHTPPFLQRLSPQCVTLKRLLNRTIGGFGETDISPGVPDIRLV